MSPVHSSSAAAIVEWFETISSDLRIVPQVAELGSYDINGTIRDHLPIKIIGFDLVAGKCVDVVIEPGVIPEEHVGKYDAVISANAFHYSVKPEEYKKEVLSLLQRNGHFVLTMCHPGCDVVHTASPNQYGRNDGLRMTEEELRAFWEPEIRVTKTYIKGHDLVLWGVKC